MTFAEVTREGFLQRLKAALRSDAYEVTVGTADGNTLAMSKHYTTYTPEKGDGNAVELGGTLAEAEAEYTDVRFIKLYGGEFRVPVLRISIRQTCTDMEVSDGMWCRVLRDGGGMLDKDEFEIAEGPL